MAEKPARLGEVMLKDVRLSYPHLFVPSSSVENGPLKFRCNFLIDPTEELGAKTYAACKAAFDAVVKDAWKEKVPPIKSDRKALRDGELFANQETGEIYAGYEDMMVVSASKGAAKSGDADDKAHSRFRPSLFYRNKEKVEDDDGTFYAGCRVDAVIRFYAETRKEKGSAGVFASLEAVRFRRDDKPFGAAAVTSDAFDDLGDDDDEMM